MIENQTVNTRELFNRFKKSMQNNNLESLVIKSNGTCAGRNVEKVWSRGQNVESLYIRNKIY